MMLLFSNRLISEMSIEENILKKSNQKRLLIDVSIEGGNFTTAFFKKVRIKISSLLSVKPIEPRQTDYKKH